MSYSFLLEMGWKSALIAGAALLLVAVLRRRSAADRGAVLRIGVAMLLLLPLVALLMPDLVVETPAGEAAASAAPDFPLPAVAPDPSFAAAPAVSLSQTGDWSDPGILFLLLYLGGVAMIGGRLVAGLHTLSRWTRTATPVESRAWTDALGRASAGRDVRLLVSDSARSPLSWRWRRPVILLDPDSARQPDHAAAVIAHEVAHIERGDWPTLILSRIAVALFWFNPLVWLLDREVAQQAEEAADSRAARQVEPALYAQTLLDWARQTATPLPANSMAGTEPGLSRRVKAILDGRIARRSGSSWTVAAMLGCAAFAVPVAALEFVPEAPEAPAVPAAPDAPAAPQASLTPPSAPAPLAPVAPPAPVQPVAAPVAPPALALAENARARAHAAAQAAAQAASAPHVDEEAIEAQVEAAVAEAMRSVEAVMADIPRLTAAATAAAKAGIAAGAKSMEQGAVGMEQGAERMRAEAAKLRDRRYREEQIRRAAARGEKVTHEDLIEAAEGLEEGAEGMREGAREMREAAEEMRRGD